MIESQVVALYKVRDGTRTREGFRQQAELIRAQVKSLLLQAAHYAPKKGDKSALAMTARTCQELLKLEPAMWLFVRVEGVEPTNNLVEQAIRPAVLWRKNSFGTQSAPGSVFVARIFTVVMNLRSQKRNTLDYLVHACQAFRNGETAPSLLPNISFSQSHLRVAA